MWSNITLSIRTLARLTWIHVPNKLSAHKDGSPITDEEVSQRLAMPRLSLTTPSRLCKP